MSIGFIDIFSAAASLCRCIAYTGDLLVPRVLVDNAESLGRVPYFLRAARRIVVAAHVCN